MPLARARADSARIARRTEVERLATGRAAAASGRRHAEGDADHSQGKLYAAGYAESATSRTSTLAGALGATDINVHGNAARMLIGEYAWTNARTSASTIALALRGDSISASGFAFDSLAANLSYRAQNGGGRVEVLVRQGDQRDYGLKGDYLVQPDLRELRIADMQLRFDTTTWQSTHAATIQSRPAGIAVQNLELRSGSTSRIYANGLLPSNGTANFDLAIDNFPVGDLLDLLAERRRSARARVAPRDDAGHAGGADDAWFVRHRARRVQGRHRTRAARHVRLRESIAECAARSAPSRRHADGDA